MTFESLVPYLGILAFGSAAILLSVNTFLKNNEAPFIVTDLIVPGVALVLAGFGGAHIAALNEQLGRNLFDETATGASALVLSIVIGAMLPFIVSGVLVLLTEKPDLRAALVNDD